MSIQVGDRLPEVTLKAVGREGAQPMKTSEIFAGKRVALFAVPGAFTPTCHIKHLPSFVDNVEAFKKKGIDTIACVAVNDPFVLGAWAEQSGGKGKILFLADPDAAFTKEIGLDFDGSAAGLGIRSKRYSMLVEDGVVKSLNIEESPGAADVSTGEKLLECL